MVLWKDEQHRKCFYMDKTINPANAVYVNTTQVSDIHPTGYQVSKLNVGNQYYIDRTFTLTAIPDEYKGLYMIKTRNDDKKTTNLGFYFNLCSNADIYVAYDYRLEPSPTSWIRTYFTLDTGKTISVNDGYGGYLNIWKPKNKGSAG